MKSPSALFESLSPLEIISAAEKHTGRIMDGTITPYNSYVNRVYGVRGEDGSDYIVKFYRAGRWTAEQILEEHRFLLDCKEAEIPVVAPIQSEGAGDFSANPGGTTSPDASANPGAIPSPDASANPGGATSPDASVNPGPVPTIPTLSRTESGLLYTVFPRLRARTFDIYCEDDWIRTGRAIGRLHAAAAKRSAPHRLQCSSRKTTEPYIRSLLDKKLIDPQLEEAFMDICDQALDYIEYAWESCFGKADASGLYHSPLFTRIHGDCHRGNILEQFVSPSPAPVTGRSTTDTASGEQSVITLIDFDDMMTGPAIQDLWLLLPGYRKDSSKEFNLLCEGYEEFAPAALAQSLFTQRRLIEPLRFMRNIYFLAWTAIQHADTGFEERNPGWGSKSFWEKELQDLTQQLRVLEAEYDYFESL